VTSLEVRKAWRRHGLNWQGAGSQHSRPLSLRRYRNFGLRS
jgi:hypothetical protein